MPGSRKIEEEYLVQAILCRDGLVLVFPFATLSPTAARYYQFPFTSKPVFESGCPEIPVRSCALSRRLRHNIAADEEVGGRGRLALVWDAIWATEQESWRCGRRLSLVYCGGVLIPVTTQHDRFLGCWYEQGFWIDAPGHI